MVALKESLKTLSKSPKIALPLKKFELVRPDSETSESNLFDFDGRPIVPHFNEFDRTIDWYSGSSCIYRENTPEKPQNPIYTKFPDMPSLSESCQDICTEVFEEIFGAKREVVPYKKMIIKRADVQLIQRELNRIIGHVYMVQRTHFKIRERLAFKNFYNEITLSQLEYRNTKLEERQKAFESLLWYIKYFGNVLSRNRFETEQDSSAIVEEIIKIVALCDLAKVDTSFVI